MLNRDDEALELLRGAAEVLESGDILFQLSGMLLERMRYAEAREVIERIPALCPLMEKRYAEALSRTKRCGLPLRRRGGGSTFAAGDKGFTKLAERPPRPARGEAGSWPSVRAAASRDAPQRRSRPWLSIGARSRASRYRREFATTAPVANALGEQNGFTARFTVDLPTAGRGDATCRLRSVEPTTSPCRVAGYDARRQTLLLRDSAALGELTADKGLEHADRPRGMVLVPKEEAAGWPMWACPTPILRSLVRRSARRSFRSPERRPRWN
jgi:hypothetical protein